MFDAFLQDLRKKDLEIIEEDCSVFMPEFVSRIEEKAAQIPFGRKRVYFSLQRSIESLEWFLAFLKAGALVFVGNPSYPQEKLALLLDYIQPQLAVIPNFQMAPFASFQKKVLTKHTSLVQFLDSTEILDPLETQAQIAIMTSGTTGDPKAVLHSISNVLRNATLHANAIGLCACDRVGLALPLHFSYGLVAVFFGALVGGASLFLAPTNVPEDLGEWLKKITVLGATPALAKRLGSFSNRILTIGGDITSPALARKILAAYPDLTLFATYGLSEAGPRVATHRVSLEDCSGELPLGEPLASIEWEIDENQELMIQTPTAMLGYFRKAEETAQAFSGKFLRTGDLAKVERGRIYFLGRKKRLITLNGEKIYLSEIENALRRFPFIEDAHVSLQEDRALKAVLQTQNIIEKRSLLSFLGGYLPRSHLPDKIECVSILPLEARRK